MPKISEFPYSPFSDDQNFVFEEGSSSNGRTTGESIKNSILFYSYRHASKISFTNPEYLVGFERYIKIEEGTSFRIRKDDGNQTVITDVVGTFDINNIIDIGHITSGTDYCVFITDDSRIFVSLDKNHPDGYEDFRCIKIGGFHTLCNDIGEHVPLTHPLYRYNAGYVLPASVWRLNHMPVSLPDGMVYCKPINLWVDIYLTASDHGEYVSKYRYDPDLNGNFYECAVKAEVVNKKFLNDYEFYCAMKGSPEGDVIDDMHNFLTGGHISSNGVRIVSDIGVEDGVGVYYQYLHDYFMYGGTHFEWFDLDVHKGMIYSDNEGFVKVVAGGYFDAHPEQCGTMCRNFSYPAVKGHENIGVRLCSDNISVL